VEARLALQEISHTVDRATLLANQMLALAKVEQLRQQAATGTVDWAEVLRDVALDLSPLLADKDIDFDIETTPASVSTHDWMLRELVRNLLHNAIRHSPQRGQVSVLLSADDKQATLRIRDSGAGISEELRSRLFQPFSAGEARTGSGLGLAICLEIVQALGGSIRLDNRRERDRVTGLDCTVTLPLGPA
jgi:two-component system, OmpR family, sensor histidine kinase TctE